MPSMDHGSQSQGAKQEKHELCITQGDLQSLGTMAGWLRQHDVPVTMSGGIYPTVTGEQNVKKALVALGSNPLWRQQFADQFEKYEICSPEEVDRARRGVMAVGSGEVPIQPNARIKE